MNIFIGILLVLLSPFILIALIVAIPLLITFILAIIAIIISPFAALYDKISEWRHSKKK